MTEEEIIERVTRYKELVKPLTSSVFSKIKVEDLKFGNHLTKPECDMVAYLVLDDGTKKYPDILFGGFENDHWIKCVVRNSLVVDEIVTEQDNMVGYFFVHAIEE